MKDRAEYLKEVKDKAIELGYNEYQVEIFKMGIMECWSDNLSPEQCVDKVF